MNFSSSNPNVQTTTVGGNQVSVNAQDQRLIYGIVTGNKTVTSSGRTYVLNSWYQVWPTKDPLTYTTAQDGIIGTVNPSISNPLMGLNGEALTTNQVYIVRRRSVAEELFGSQIWEIVGGSGGSSTCCNVLGVFCSNNELIVTYGTGCVGNGEVGNMSVQAYGNFNFTPDSTNTGYNFFSGPIVTAPALSVNGITIVGAPASSTYVEFRSNSIQSIDISAQGLDVDPLTGTAQLFIDDVFYADFTAANYNLYGYSAVIGTLFRFELASTTDLPYNALTGTIRTGIPATPSPTPSTTASPTPSPSASPTPTPTPTPT
jgi:hypothetical protein